MSYRRALLTRWSRRDRLAVLVVAVTVAFLVGTTLLVLAAGAQTASIAAQFDSPGSVTAHALPDAARASDPDAVVLPLGRVNGTTVVGVPPNASVGGVALTEAIPPDWTVREPAGVTPSEGALAVHPGAVTDDAAAAGTPTPTNASGRAGDSERGDSEGESSAIDAVVPAEGVPLLSALAFFVAGTEQALVVLGVAAVSGGLLVAVTTYSVTRMSVRDRRPTIRVVRATGAAPRTVLGLFAARAGLLTGVGVALGYAVGVIATNSAVNAAVFVGLPTSLAARVTPRAVEVLVPLFGALLAVGIGSGVAAAWSAARAPPGSLTDPVAGRGDQGGSGRLAGLRAVVRPGLLGWRPLVPTAATLTAFVLFVALAAALAGVVAPLSGGSGPAGALAGDSESGPSTTTILQPGSTHPVSSRLPEGYATALRSRGTAASPEVLLFEVVDGQPVPARGANYTAFARVTDAELVRGRAPRNTSEAVVGEGLAASLDLAVGDRLLLGGSTQPAVTRVRVVGTYGAPGPFDDQVVVPLGTARSLSGLGAAQVNLIRTTGLPTVGNGAAGNASGLGVSDLSIPDRVAADGRLDARVTVRNEAPAQQSGTVRVRYREEVRRVDVDLAALGSETRTVSFPAGPAGQRTIEAGDARTTVRVVPRDAIALRSVPRVAPSGSDPLVRVVNASGAPTRATVTVTNGSWNRSRQTGGAGRVRLPLPTTTGEYAVTAVADGQRATTTVRVEADAGRRLDATLRVQPSAPSTLVRPTAALVLRNPWNETVRRDVRLDGPATTTRQPTRLAPGERTTVEVTLPRRPPAEYEVRAALSGGGSGTRELNATYRVTGDDRIVAALATSGQQGTTGIGQAIEVAFGNLGLLVGTLVLLATLMTVGGTTAAFAAAVAARRRTLGVHRATGASPARVARLVLADALRIGVVAGLVAVVLASLALFGLGAADLLVVFGVRLGFPSARVLLACGLGAVALTLVAAALAVVGPLRAPPARLLSGGGVRAPDGDGRAASPSASGAAEATVGRAGGTERGQAEGTDPGRTGGDDDD